MKAKKQQAAKQQAQPAFQPRKAADGSFHPSEKQQAAIDDAIRKTVRERFKEVVAVEGLLGVRYGAPTDEWMSIPYQRYLLANGHTVFVSLATGSVTVSEKPASKTSYSVSEFLYRKARKAKRAAAKAVKA